MAEIGALSPASRCHYCSPPRAVCFCSFSSPSTLHCSGQVSGGGVMHHEDERAAGRLRVNSKIQHKIIHSQLNNAKFNTKSDKQHTINLISSYNHPLHSPLHDFLHSFSRESTSVHLVFDVERKHLKPPHSSHCYPSCISPTCLIKTLHIAPTTPPPHPNHTSAVVIIS